jgi:hypothetical protein
MRSHNPEREEHAMPEQQPTPPAAPAPGQVPLTWQCGYQPLPGGGTICTVQLQQAAVAFLLQLPPDDLERLGQALVDTARKARTGLVTATELPTVGNGRPPLPG